MNVFSFISLFGGLALFLYGMRIMGDGLKQSSSGTLKNVMEKVTNNPFTGFLLGMLVTAIIQSSTATIVITSGLVGAGIITLHQSVGIIIGANVGTTITAQIIRLLDINAEGASWLNMFKPSTLAPVAAVIGILLIMAFKFKSSDTIGNIAMGFGILFTGLLNMTNAVAPLSTSPKFAQLFITLADKPVLGFLAGTGVAFSIQSSSATVGILQALSVTGQLSLSSIYSILFGIYLGDCVTTAIVCSIGAKANAKRTGVIHILFNLTGALIVLIGVTVLHKTGVLDGIWSVPITSGGIANTHTIFKLTGALLLLPVCGLFEKLSMVIVREQDSTDVFRQRELQLLDKAFFRSPAIALDSVRKAMTTMASLACNNVNDAMMSFQSYDGRVIELINEDEDHIDSSADNISDYIVQLSPYVELGRNDDRVNYYIKCIDEWERIGDYAVNLTENSTEIFESENDFSPKAMEELLLLKDALNEILDHARKAFCDDDQAAALNIEPVEEVIDEMVATLRSNHIERLRQGLCNVDAGYVFLDILTNVERISDQCSNIGLLTIALHNPEIGEQHHDYIRRLHQGEDEYFNTEYASTYAAYFERLNAIEFDLD